MPVCNREERLNKASFIVMSFFSVILSFKKKTFLLSRQSITFANYSKILPQQPCGSVVLYTGSLEKALLSLIPLITLI